jgi:SNF2 family DNA or RNA helicase
VTDVKIYDGLVQGKVKGFSSHLEEARLKLQAGPSPLVWTECSCLLSRRRGEMCEHVAALCVYLFYQENFYENDRYFFDHINATTIPVGSHEAKQPTDIDFSHNLRAHRVFYANYDENSKIKVTKAIEISDLEDPTFTEIHFLDEVNTLWLRHDGVVHAPQGFIPFDDELDEYQENFWLESPSLFEASDEAIASYLGGHGHDAFHGISVLKSESLSKISIIKKIGAITYKEQQEESSPDDHTSLQAWVHLPLIDILRARRQGREYIKTKKGFVYVGKQFDWLIKNTPSKSSALKSQEVILKPQDIIRLEAETQSIRTPHQTPHQGGGEKTQDAWIDRLKDGVFSSFENFSLPEHSLKKMSLRSYQEEGLKWLWWLYEYGLGGILADEMGLGKTHQALALFETIVQTKKTHSRLFLVVCPNSVMEHWCDKIKRFTSHLHGIRYHGAGRGEHWKQLLEHAQKKNGPGLVLVTTYGLLLKDCALFQTMAWNVVVLDEAHLIKNRKTQTYHAALQLQSYLRLCLTGTPIENDIADLKTIFDYILPNYLRGIKDLRKMMHLVQPFKLRRKKSEVLKELPEKTEDIRYCRMTNNQRELYVKTLNSVVEALSDNQNPIPYIHIFSLITLLKQICDDPGLIGADYESLESGKIHLFEELLDEALAENKKVVVFSQYAKMITRLSQRLHKKNIGHVVLTGQTRKRGEVIQSFQEDETKKVFLGSLLAGGMGIDLTSASLVIHFDRWWNAAKENQGTDRVHRIGQTQQVYVYKLVTKNSIEEKIDALILKKKGLLDEYLDGEENFLKNFSREEFLSLLS